jgi:hypothetical protein
MNAKRSVVSAHLPGLRNKAEEWYTSITSHIINDTIIKKKNKK